ncbi:unnamed protein product [Citrullus colocynthis]|uniref:Uncharacterized protein n=1 Tax=Citrullus colocynthis TaxID=252529 RepID=A0ABP0XXT9_9ROSI
MLRLSCLESCDRIDLSLEKNEESLVWRNNGESIPVSVRRVLLFDTYLSPTSTDRAKDTWDLTWGYVMSFREVISYTKENKGKTGPYAAAAQNGERSKRKDKQSKVSGCLMMVGLCASAKDTVPHLLLFPLERQPHLCREKRDTYLMVVIGAPKSVCSLSPICSFFTQPFHCHFPH